MTTTTADDKAYKKVPMNLKVRVALSNMVNELYAKSGMTDAEFARHFTAETGHACADHHVRYVRGEFDVPGNLKVEAKSLIDRVADLELALARAISRIDALAAARTS